MRDDESNSGWLSGLTDSAAMNSDTGAGVDGGVGKCDGGGLAASLECFSNVLAKW